MGVGQGQGGVAVGVGVRVGCPVGVGVGVVGACRFLKRTCTQFSPLNTVTSKRSEVTGSQPACISSHTSHWPGDRLGNSK
ncbi:MAG TPA: hypothetical protein EYH29_06230 [Caldilineales bacterium]|nr:hypothetical protein [Caldilineales bacterium]